MLSYGAIVFMGNINIGLFHVIFLTKHIYNKKSRNKEFRNTKLGKELNFSDLSKKS